MSWHHREALSLNTLPLFFVLLWIVLSTTDAWQLLAKTTETFKLADLQLLAARIECQRTSCSRPRQRVERIVLDAATGSSLLQVVSENDDNDEWSRCSNWPNFLQRCDWVGIVLARAETAAALVHEIANHSQQGRFASLRHPWTLRYVKMTDHRVARHSARRTTDGYTYQTLVCAVAQAIESPQAALDTTGAGPIDRLLVVDATIFTNCPQESPITTEQLAKTLYLVQEMDIGGNDSDGNRPQLAALWKQRPFLYSSAINPGIAQLVIDILWNCVRAKRKRQGRSLDSRTAKKDNNEPPIHLLDPVCGSGTFLATALYRGGTDDVVVTGWDVNTKCVEGTRENLDRILRVRGDTNSSYPRFSVQTRDARDPVNDILLISPPVDCAACNLPWGLNTAISDENQNVQILRALRQSVGPGIPCAIVSKEEQDNVVDTNHDEEEEEAMVVMSSPVLAFLQRADAGYRILGRARVPPRNFRLPLGVKKQKNNKEKQAVDNGSTGRHDKSRSHCVVTIVETI